MKTIALSTGELALVDDCDFERLSRFKWSLILSRKGDKQGYAKRGVWVKETKKVITVFMHHDVLGVDSSVRVDHENGIKLDNQRENLRPATVTQNAGNSRWRNTPGRTSRFKGVHWHIRRKKFQATLMTTVNGKPKCKHLGYFDSETEAARAYNSAARHYFREFARLNSV